MDLSFQKKKKRHRNLFIGFGDIKKQAFLPCFFETPCTKHTTKYKMQNTTQHNAKQKHNKHNKTQNTTQHETQKQQHTQHS